VKFTDGEFIGIISALGGNIGLLDIDINGNVKIIDSVDTTLIRLLFSKSNIPLVADILSTSQPSQTVTNPAAIYGSSGTYILNNSVNVTYNNSTLTFSGKINLEASLDDMNGNMSGMASVSIVLLKDGARYATLASKSVYLDLSNQSAYYEENFSKALIVGVGTYKIEIVVGFNNANGSAGLSEQSTLQWAFLKDIRRFEFDIDGFMAWYTNNHMYFSETGGLDVRGATNIPGLLAMGRVSSTGSQDTNKIWGAKAATDNCSKNGTGVFRVPHKVLHSKITGIAIPTSSGYIISQTGETAATKDTNGVITNGYVEFTIISRSSGANADIGFNYYIYGNNY
jgi:hypothetical protein